MLKSARLAAAFVAALLLSGVAQAGLLGHVEGDFAGWGTQGNDGLGQSVLGEPAYNGGRFAFNVTSSDVVANGTQLQLFCAEIFQNIGTSGHYAYNLVTLDMAPLGSWTGASGADAGPPMTDDAVKLIKDLYANHYSGEGDSTTNTDVGSFQLNIWAMEYFGSALKAAYSGTALNATTVNGITSSSFVDGSLALQWLNESLDHLYHNTNQDYNVYALVSDGAQDQLVVLNSVPEPGSLAVWGLLGVAGVLYRRRKSR